MAGIKYGGMMEIKSLRVNTWSVLELESKWLSKKRRKTDTQWSEMQCKT